MGIQIPETEEGAIFKEWLQGQIDEIRAQAWDEGIAAFDGAIIKDIDDPWAHIPDNPYRTGAE